MNHKRKKCIVGLFLAALSSMLFISCNDGATSEEKTSTTINGVNVVYTRAVAKPVDKNNTKYELATSFKDEDFYYYMYYLGRIEHIPLQSDNETIIQQHTGVPFSYTFSSTSTTTSSIETQIAEANEECSNWQKEEFISGELKIKAEKEFPAKSKASLEIAIKGGYQKAWGGETTTIMEESITEAQEFSEEFSKEITVSFDDNLEHGFYRYILMGDIDVFATIVYNVEEDIYYCENTNSIVSRYYTLDYSDNSEFLSATNQNLPFDCPDLSKLAEPTLDCTPEITPEDPVISYNSAAKSLIVNLSSYQETGAITLEDTSENKWIKDHFKDNVLTIPPKYNSQEIKKVKIVGSYLKEDEDGYDIETSISNFSIRLDQGIDHDLKIVLQNVAFSSPSNASALDLAGISEHKVRLMFKGENKIESNGSQFALQANNLQMEAMEDGAKIEFLGTTAQNGGNGGAAITCTNLTVLSGDITVKGGDGGNGAHGGAPAGDTDGYHGTAGSKGGNGGIALITEKLSLNGGKIQIQGGKGGDGGVGGNGNSAFTFCGNGGAGGNGGNGGSALKVSTISVKTSATFTIQGGNGGKGGNGGYGGGDKLWRGTSGNGGNGGVGGNVFAEKVESAPEQTESFIVGEGGNAGSRGGCWGSNTNYGSHGSNGNKGTYNP